MDLHSLLLLFTRTQHHDTTSRTLSGPRGASTECTHCTLSILTTRMVPSWKLLVGTTVKVHGVKAKPELNDCAAIVGSFNADKNRYNVRVALPEANDYVEVALKPDNLMQGAAARLPPAATVEADEYAIADVLDVLDAVETMDEYPADVAVACLTRCVECLMEDVGLMPSEPRMLTGALAALRTNAQNEGAAPNLFGVAILGLPFVLGGRDKAAMLDAAEAHLECSLLTLLAAGLGWYETTHELLSSTMIAVRQALACYVDGDDTVDFSGVDDERWATVDASGLLPALVRMLAAHPARFADEATLELHEHAIAAFSAVSGLAPSEERAATLVKVGVLAPVLRAMEAVASAAAALSKKKKGAKSLAKEQLEAALELVRAGGALLKAVGGTSAGRAGLRAAGGVATLTTVMEALPHPALVAEMGALKTRLESADGADVSVPLTSRQRVEGGTPRAAAPSYVASRNAREPQARAPAKEVAEIAATYYY